MAGRWRALPQNGWKNLHLYASGKLDALEETGSSANGRGIARDCVGLRSLAYESYAQAARLGTTVARCNMAALVHSGSPAAALAILHEHTGSFDAADPGYPHQLRAYLERAHRDEREQERKMLAIAERQFEALWAFAEKIISARKGAAPRPKGHLLCGSNVITLDEAGIHVSGPTKATVQELRLFGPNVFTLELNPGIAFISTAEEVVLGLFFEDFSTAAGLSWCHWVPQEAIDSVTALSGDDEDTS